MIGAHDLARVWRVARNFMDCPADVTSVRVMVQDGIEGDSGPLMLSTNRGVPGLMVRSTSALSICSANRTSGASGEAHRETRSVRAGTEREFRK